jgi:hypothetical protein
MRSLINAMNSVVVNGQVDRTNVAGIGLLRGSDLLLRSRLYAALALQACAYFCGITSCKHAHLHAAAIEQMRSIATGAPCWRPERPITGSLALACAT